MREVSLLEGCDYVVGEVIQKNVDEQENASFKSLPSQASFYREVPMIEDCPKVRLLEFRAEATSLSYRKGCYFVVTPESAQRLYPAPRRNALAA